VGVGDETVEQQPVGENWRPPTGAGIGKSLVDAMRVSRPPLFSVLRSTVAVGALLVGTGVLVTVFDGLLSDAPTSSGWLLSTVTLVLVAAAVLALTIPLSFGDTAEYLSPPARRRYALAVLLTVSGLCLGSLVRLLP